MIAAAWVGSQQAENTADPDFPVPKRARAIADLMWTKQNHFLKSLVVTHYTNISKTYTQLLITPRTRSFLNFSTIGTLLKTLPSASLS
jgi:hypothetical protein